jgi:tetratricopeptide (TPR) repeat protein
MEEMQQVVAILPSHPLFRHNLALYANYASEFDTAEREASAIEDPDLNAVLARAFAQLGQNRFSEAKATYERLQRMNAQGASFAASGLGDLATLEGRFADAVRILRQAVPADLEAGNPDAAASKLVAVAYAELSRERFAAAAAATTEALALSDRVNIKFLSARTLIEAGEIARAQQIADAMGAELYPEPRAHAKMLEGLIALRGNDARGAIGALREANELFDTWIGHFDLGRAFLATGQNVQADSEFDECLNRRRGEALSLFVDEEPTYAYVAHAYYYLGRGRQAIGDQRYTELYKTYLDLRGRSTDDRFVGEVQRALAGGRR